MGNQVGFNTDKKSSYIGKDLLNPFEVAKIIKDWCITQQEIEKNLGKKNLLKIVELYLKCFLNPNLNVDIGFYKIHSRNDLHGGRALENTRLLLVLYSFIKILTFNKSWKEPKKIYNLLTQKITEDFIKNNCTEKIKNTIGFFTDNEVDKTYKALTSKVNEPILKDNEVILAILTNFNKYNESPTKPDFSNYILLKLVKKMFNGFAHSYYILNRFFKIPDLENKKQSSFFLIFRKNKGEVAEFLTKTYNQLHDYCEIKYTKDHHFEINGELKIYFTNEKSSFAEDEDSDGKYIFFKEKYSEIKSEILTFNNNNDDEIIPIIDSFEIINNNNDSNSNSSAQLKNNTAQEKFDLPQQEAIKELAIDNNQDAIELKEINYPVRINSNTNSSLQSKNNIAHKKLSLFQQEETPMDNNQEAIELKIITKSNN